MARKKTAEPSAAPAEIIGYWFAAGDELPRGDGRRVVIGETLTVEPPIIPCERGLHASVDPFDALQYAPGAILYKVRLSGEIVAHDNNKYAASERTALARRDATEMLQVFGRKMALSVIHLWDAPPVVREYLETGDESKRAGASAAASAAAWDPESAAARDPATVAWDPASAWDAARAAARSAAGAAARASDAGAAARAAASATASATAVAWDARVAARASASAAAKKLFSEMVAALFDEPA